MYDQEMGVTLVILNIDGGHWLRFHDYKSLWQGHLQFFRSRRCEPIFQVKRQESKYSINFTNTDFIVNVTSTV